MPSADRITGLHEAVRKDEPNLIDGKLSMAGYQCGTSPATMLLLAIDPASGDSLFHTAMRTERLDALSTLRKTFPPNGSFEIPTRLLLKHKNYQGETILHVAAQTGNQDMVTAAYRLFCRDSLPNERRFTPTPAEERNPGFEDGSRLPPLMFLLEQNAASQDAASVARTNGYEDVARWIERLVTKLDPHGDRNDAKERERMQEFVRQRQQHRYTEIHVEDDEVYEDDSDDEEDADDKHNHDGKND
ncbi:hypothetical protein DL764_006893 [Monosporascus ibericus]|uniref:Ankyrin repeat protein n=1 Tax=Monosporascus ibericus TaxID=155417 RepID=A0A4Q4T3K5_9PEZI|nr:hypothetical protein DL764_006893 [Monosporascus ibericus]